MTTIAAENRKYLRQAMRVDCGFRETNDEPTSITPIGADPDYMAIVNFGHEHLTTPIMDLAGDGFLSDGRAVPMHTDTDSYRYGYISEGVAKADGTFTTPFGLTLEADKDWPHITVEVMDQSGNVWTETLEPVWALGQTTVYIETSTPGQRAYIVGFFLGNAWIWTNENILSVSADLRGVNTEIGGELEVSSITIEAYEPNDPTEFIGDIPLGAPIWYIAGYEGDLGPMRRFYLSDLASWENNVLTVQGQDATSLLENIDVHWTWWSYDITTAMAFYIDWIIGQALDSVEHETIGNYPATKASDPGNIYLETMAARTIISLYTGFYRDADLVRVTYVDAGAPRLTWGDNADEYTIYADEIADLKVTVEQNINEIDVNIATYEEAAAYEEFETFNAVANRTYYFNIDAPVTSWYMTPAQKSYAWIGNSTLKIVANETAETTLFIKPLETVLDEGNNPYKLKSTKPGVPYEYDAVLPALPTVNGPFDKLSVPALLARSNRLFEFTYRGDPHIQPRDVLNVEVATWEDYFETIDGLYPATDLYPAADLYPYAEYKKGRRMVKHWEVMTVDSLTLDHKEGGLTSTIRARKGVV